jgi:hypothetical protein
MANNDASLSIGGNIDDLKAATEKATAQVKQMADQMQGAMGSLNSAFQKIHGTFLAFTAVIAGGAAFKGVINASNEWAGESQKLAKSLGITTEQASVMKVALNHIGMEADTLITASQKMSKQIGSNGQAFEEMGVKVKDSTGQYRPVTDVMAEVNQKLVAIHNPIQQNIAGMQVYGKGWAEIKPILKLTADTMAEAEKRAKELHLIVGPDGVAQAKQYKEQMRDLNLVGKSLEVQFGNALTPAFVKLGAWMGKEAPAMGEVFSNVLLTVAAAAQTVWVTITRVGETLGGLAAAAVQFLHGNFSAAGSILGDIIDKNKTAVGEIKTIWATAYDRPAAKVSSAPEMGGPSYDFGKDGKGKDKSDKSRMGEWEAELAETKVKYQTENDLREYSKQQEVAYWEARKALTEKGSAEETAIKRKVATLQLEILKKANQDKRGLDAEAITAAEKVGEDAVKMDQDLAARDLALGKISKEQMLALELQFEDRRFAIRQEAQAARITAALGDPSTDPVALQKLLDQMLEIQRQHGQQVTQLETQQAVESKARWEQMLSPIGNAFEKSATGIIQGTTTMQKALSNIWNSITAEFVSMTVKLGVRWAAMELAKTVDTQKGSVLRLALEKMGLLQTAAAETAASTTTAAGKKMEAAAVIPAEAAEAAGGAASAVAGIPIVGPALAAAAYAETMAMVMGGLSVASAKNGFDIPAGVNPMTQLHEKEMVLSEGPANVIRGLADGGGAGGTHLHVHSLDVQGVRDWFRSNSEVLGPAVRRAARNFAPTSISSSLGKVY